MAGSPHHRFITVAAALGRSEADGTGYAARLQARQDAADAAAGAVNGTAANAGSEAERRAAWTCDDAEVARLKGKYNAAVGQLHASAQAISAAVAGRAIDAVGLVTFGIGKGLIGGGEATADISEAAASSYRAVAGEDATVADIIEAGDTAARTLSQAAQTRLVAKCSSRRKTSSRCGRCSARR